MQKLRILLGFSKLSVVKPLTAIVPNMRNFIAIFAGIHGICKDFAANRINEHGNVQYEVALPPPPDGSATKTFVPADYSALR